MRIEIINRPLPSGKPYYTIVNSITRKFLGQIGPNDSVFVGQRIVEAVNFYQDLHDAGLLIKVMAALEKYKNEQQK